MIRGQEDLFVGAIAITVGLSLVGCAITNWEWYYTLPTARWLQRPLGRTGARCVHALLGLGLIALGIAIALGYRWPLVGPG